MRLLVPLAFEVSDIAHGRNLRVIELLRQLVTRCDVAVLAANEAIARSLRIHLPDADITVPVPDSGLPAPVQTGFSQRCIAFHDAHPALAAAVAGRASDFDVVLGFGLPALASLVASRCEIPQPVRICDIIDDPLLTWASLPASDRFSIAGLKAALVARHLRGTMLPTLDAVITAGARDTQSLRTAGVDRAVWIPNGVDPEPLDAVQCEREPLAVFTGFMSFPPNERAALHLVTRIWPRVHAALVAKGRHDIRLALVGADPSSRLRHAARAAKVIVTGRVPSVRHWLLRARLAIAPMQSGSGIKNKVLEALACGCPVVTTPLGASGLPTGDGSGIRTATTIGDIARACATLLAAPREAAELGRAGHNMICRQFTWPLVADCLRQTMETLLERRAGARPTPARPVHSTPRWREEAWIDATT